jgi:hypothetical protein
MAILLADLPRQTFPVIGLAPVTQWFPVDHSTKNAGTDGSTHRGGYMKYELLWTRLDTAQHDAFLRIIGQVPPNADLHITGRWYDSNNPAIRWVDLKGKPDWVDATPNPPAFAYGVDVFSAIKLTLNNVELVNDPASY